MKRKTSAKATVKSMALKASTGKTLKSKPANGHGAAAEIEKVRAKCMEASAARYQQRLHIVGQLVSAIRVIAETETLHPCRERNDLHVAIEEVAKATLQKDDEYDQSPPNLVALSYYADAIEEFAYFLNPIYRQADARRRAYFEAEDEAEEVKATAH